MLKPLSDRSWGERYQSAHLTSMRSVFGAFLSHIGMQLNLVVVVLALAGWAISGAQLGLLGLAAIVSVVGYPLVEYILHRYVLHATFLCRWKATADLWRRLHYDHHMDPTDLTVLFADPKTSLPLVAVLAAVPALLMGSWGVFFSMLATHTLVLMYYEFMHMVAHALVELRPGWLAERKRRHLRHHFIDEKRDFGIGTNVVDDLLTLGHAEPAAARSESVRNLGYDDALASRFPWVRDSYARRNSSHQTQTTDPSARPASDVPS